MAIGVLMTMPGVKQEQYEQVNQKMFGHSPMDPSEAPDGLVLHSAGPIPDGWYVYDVWESKEQFDRFVQDQVGPAVQEVMGGAMGPEPQYFEIASLVKAP